MADSVGGGADRRQGLVGGGHQLLRGGCRARSTVCDHRRPSRHRRDHAAGVQAPPGACRAARHPRPRRPCRRRSGGGRIRDRRPSPPRRRVPRPRSGHARSGCCSAQSPTIRPPPSGFPADYVPLVAGDRLDLAGLTIDVMHTPGHTPGHCCFHLAGEGVLFTGDQLFAGSIGRTDLPGGDLDTLIRSMAGVLALDDATRVLPGHGPGDDGAPRAAHQPIPASVGDVSRRRATVAEPPPRPMLAFGGTRTPLPQRGRGKAQGVRPWRWPSGTDAPTGARTPPGSPRSRSWCTGSGSAATRRRMV